ncbi:MAG: tRNA lysidine(34) synthetase TilS [Bdellovibrionia bacterium]
MSLSQAKATRYPKPGPIGGNLIREVISFLKSQNLKLPLGSHILIAVSGGSDSIGLAHLLVHFGRRIVARSQISLLHVNHGWRAEESDADEAFVKELGKRWKIPVIVHRLDPSKNHKAKKSWEDEARGFRKEVFACEAEKLDRKVREYDDKKAHHYNDDKPKNPTLVLTGHQADDQAETLLWRLFTGAAETHGGGVVFRYGIEMRPFLTCRKALIKNYLLEVDQSYREDATNQSDRFMRARMRSQLMPAIEKLFPRAIDHLVRLALSAQAGIDILTPDEAPEALDRTRKQNSNLGNTPLNPYDTLIAAAGLKVRRPHFKILSEKLVAKKPWCGEIHLPGGWKLICQPPEKWILERI